MPLGHSLPRQILFLIAKNSIALINLSKRSNPQNRKHIEDGKPNYGGCFRILALLIGSNYKISVYGRWQRFGKYIKFSSACQLWGRGSICLNSFIHSCDLNFLKKTYIYKIYNEVITISSTCFNIYFRSLNNQLSNTT